MNFVQKLKQNLHKNPKPYLITAATSGMVVGVVVTAKYTKTDPTKILARFLDENAQCGFTVYALDAAQEKLYLQALNK